MKKFKILTLLFLLFLPYVVRGLELDLDLYSKNVVLYDIEDEKIVYEKNSTEVTNIASLTKIMTTIVAIENIKNFDKEVYITSDMLSSIPSDASKAGLKVGDKVTFRDLLYASLLPSGADATSALAMEISGSIPKFVDKMNAKAKELGLENTHFVNVTGYDADNHHSTAQEVLKLLNYSLKNELFKEIYTTRSRTLKNGLKVSSTLNLYNKYYNYNLEPIKGSKTGFTSKAGMCMAAIIDTGGREFILISLGAKVVYGAAYNLVDTMNIVNYLKDTYENKVLFSKDEVIYRIPIEYSKESVYEIKPESDITKYLDKKDPTKGTIECNLKDSLNPSMKKGDKIGEIRYLYGEDELKRETVYLDRDLEISYYKILTSKVAVCIYFFLILIIILILIKKKLKKKRSTLHRK